MDRIKEKVKDLVDVKRHVSISNFWADPGATLEAYHFTDGTAELMAKWLQGISKIEEQGTGRAVAGYRGVGKSHFLAVFAALTAHPELRSKIPETQVLHAAQDLLRRHYPVVNVRRGSGPTLAAELAEAMAMQFGIDLTEIGTAPADILRHARTRTGDLPLILIVDTASDRPGQVRRNDGDALSEIAEFCASNGSFVAVALDDDIAGAEGDNVSIAKHFTFDYLDQEHLYRAVNARIFVKEPRKQEAIRAIYETIRTSTKGFRWSEERFTAMYPLHPVTLEITPFIRRFVSDFSILNFASSAGERILSRPADSLIGLEDLFEATENDLRKNEELNGAFETFDFLQKNVVESLPVKDRHRVKLILKALLLLSLDGTGKSTQEIVTGLMLPESATDAFQETSRILDSFVSTLPEGIVEEDLDGSAKRYSFRTGLDEHSAELARWISAQPSDAVDQAFKSAIARKFFEFEERQFSAYGRNAVQMSLEWRGSLRRGLLIFGEASEALTELETDPDIEWEIYFDLDIGELGFAPNSYPARIAWRPDDLLLDECSTLLGFWALSENADIRSSFGEKLSAAEQAHSAAAMRVVDRALFENVRLEIEGFDFNFTEQARTADGLSSIMSIMLEPVFETRYSEHPLFTDTLTDEKVEHAVSSIFGGPDEFSDEREVAAQLFGLPLSIVIEDPAGLRRANKEELRENAYFDPVFKQIDVSNGHIPNLSLVDDVLRQQPLGLCVGARRLIYAALTANGFIDLVTKDGNRINGRSLDLKIAWGEIAGIAIPREGNVSNETILKWAREITLSPEINSLQDSEARTKVMEALVDISSRYAISRKPASLGGWNEYGLNAATWCDMHQVAESYERVIEYVDETLVGSVELESCVGQICTSFGDRTEVFRNAQLSAARIERYSKFQNELERIQNYISRVEYTFNDVVEEARSDLVGAITAFGEDANGDLGREVGYLFEKFLRSYIDVYAEGHAKTFDPGAIRAELIEILASDDSRRIQSAFLVREFGSAFRAKFRDAQRQIESLNCKADPAEHLRTYPQCLCSFHLGEAETYKQQPDVLRELVNTARQRLQEIVGAHRDELTEFLRNSKADEPEMIGLAEELKNKGADLDLVALSQKQFDQLVTALSEISRS